MDFGNITTNIIKSGLVFNMDAANRASTIFILKWYTAQWPSFIAPSGSVTPVWEGTHAECLTKLTSSFWTSGSIS